MLGPELVGAALVGAALVGGRVVGPEVTGVAELRAWLVEREGAGEP